MLKNYYFDGQIKALFVERIDKFRTIPVILPNIIFPARILNEIN